MHCSDVHNYFFERQLPPINTFLQTQWFKKLNVISQLVFKVANPPFCRLCYFPVDFPPSILIVRKYKSSIKEGRKDLSKRLERWSL